jgi:hypothetical protein
MKLKAWNFTIEVMGYGKNKDEAFENALEEGISNVTEPIKAVRDTDSDYDED